MTEEEEEARQQQLLSSWEPSVGSSVWGWSRVCPTLQEGPHAPPCQRSLHVAAVLKDQMFIFGGYDGSNRVNDFCASLRHARVTSSLSRELATPPPALFRFRRSVFASL